MCACRELKNKTGVDVSVSSYDPAPSAKQVKHYHVVVITKLPFFKLAGHSEDDLVHFMVSLLFLHEKKCKNIDLHPSKCYGLSPVCTRPVCDAD